MTLAEFIIRNMEIILSEWEAFARTIPAGEEMGRKGLRDHAEKMLKVIARDLVQPQSPSQQVAKSQGKAPEPGGDETAATSHGTDRYVEGFDLDALVSEYRALRATVTRLWGPEGSSGDRETQLSRFNEAIDQALHESVVRYSEEVNRSRELFLGVLGHDLRTPLGVCLMSAQYLLQSEGLSGDQLRVAATLLKSTTRIQKMTADLLDVTRTRLGGALPIERKPMDLLATCRQVVEEVRAFHPNRTVALNSKDDLRGAWDETRLYQLLSNLMENAVRHGTGTQPVTVSASGDDRSVRITVHNDGPPIPKSEIHRIFEPLRQTEQGATRTEGLGLGLYISRAIVEAHRGVIEVESSLEAGTSFTVQLPRLQQPLQDSR